MLALTLALVLSQSLEGDFVLPVFAHPDAGAEVLGPPSAPPLESVPMVEPHQSFPEAVLEPQAEPTWARVVATANMNVQALGTLGLGLEGFVGTMLGKPTIAETPPSHSTDVLANGLVLSPGVEGGFLQMSARICGRTSLCASRASLGGSMRVGWGEGVAKRKTGSTSPNRMYFGQVGVLAGYGWVPSAPLAPAVEWVELVIRVRAGVYWAVVKSTVVTISVVFEGVPVSYGNRGLSLGFTLGFAF